MNFKCSTKKWKIFSTQNLLYIFKEEIFYNLEYVVDLLVVLEILVKEKGCILGLL